MKKIIFLIFLCLFGTFFYSRILSQEYDPDFNKNYIISDFQMFDYNSMTQAQIQQFLQIKNSYLANYYTEGWPIHCDTKTGSENSNCQIMIQMSAAEIIYSAAQRYKVNPKYILVMLQKEQGLIQWNGVPPERRLDWAAGYGCPDGKECNPRFKGFGKQVDNSAGIMRFYYDNASIYDSWIRQANKQTIINGEIIIPVNQATANLYTYTPHIRGNYTFWRVWQGYFGDPFSDKRDTAASISTEYMLQIIGSSDEEILIKEGEMGAYWVEYLNIGTKTWTNETLNKLYLIDAKYETKIPIISKTSTFVTDDAIRSDIKVYSQRQSVAPGEVLRITVTERSSLEKLKSYSYVLVYEGRGWFADSDISFNTKTQFNYDGVYQGGVPASMEPLKKHTLRIQYKNTGLLSWNKNDVKLKYVSLDGKENFVSMTQTSVSPGKIAEFVISDTPKSVGSQSYQFSLYRQIDKINVQEFPNSGQKINTNISVKLGAQLIEHNIPKTMTPGEIRSVTVKFRNAGTDKWDKNLVFRAYDRISPFTRSIFRSNDWESSWAIGRIKETVNSGEEYSFTFNIKAPSKQGQYPLYLQLEWGNRYQEIIIDDVISKKFIIDVNRNVVQSEDSSKKTILAQGISFNLPQTMSPGEIKPVTLILKNIGTEKWDHNYVLRSYREINPFLGSHFYDQSWISVMAVDRVRAFVHNGDKYAFTFRIKAPSKPGTYKLYLQFEYGSKYEEIDIDGEKTKEYIIEVK